VYNLDDGKPYFSIEIAHMDEETNLVSSMTMQLSDPRESDLWLSSIKKLQQTRGWWIPYRFVRDL
jgi:hypothetical protein